MMYKTVLFDLDGTLIDSKESIIHSFQYALASFGVGAIAEDELSRFIGPPIRDMFRGYFHFSDSETECAVKKVREYFSERGIFENKLYHGIPELLARLKKDGIRLAVATSKPTVFARQIIERFAMEQYFTLIAGSETNGTRSRKSDVIRFVMDAVTERPAVMIGDRMHDIIGAKEAEIDSIGVGWGYGSFFELEQAGAGTIAKTPEELYRYIAKGGDRQ